MPTTVILGGGIIGLSTAYYLSQLAADSEHPTSSSQQQHTIHLVEASPEFFASASGKAAGFLAKDWFAPAVSPLGAFSFELHRQLADEFGGSERWGWSESESYSMDRDDDVEEEDGSERASSVVSSPCGGSRTRSTDLEWLMSGSSRATLLEDLSPEGIKSSGDFPTWVRARREMLQTISDRTTTAQVDPYRLCSFLLEESKARGVIVHQPARASALIPAGSSSSSSSSATIRIQHLAPTTGLGPDAEVEDSRRSPSPSSYEDATYFGTPTETIDILVDNIIIAAGCWTPRVYRTLFPNAHRIPRISALAGHSVVMKSKHWSPAAVQPDKVKEIVQKAGVVSVSLPTESSVEPTLKEGFPRGGSISHAIFTSDPAGYSPEVFSRVSGDVWLGGLNSSSIPLPPLPHLARPDPEAIHTLVETGKALCGSDVEVVREGLCFRPVAPTGLPLVARVHGVDLVGEDEIGDTGGELGKGVYVATGHGPWGISMSLGTGYVVSEMVLGRPASVDVKALGWQG